METAPIVIRVGASAESALQAAPRELRIYERSPHRWRRWHVRNRQDALSPGGAGLHADLVLAPPAAVFVAVPALAHEALSKELANDLADVVVALRAARRERDVDVVVLVDGELPQGLLRDYEALLSARAFHAQPAKMLLAGIARPHPTVWSGDAAIAGTDNALPGLRITHPSAAPLPSVCHLVAAGRTSPPVAHLMAARPGYILSLRHDAQPHTVRFLSSCHASRMNFLLRFDQLHIWCFWNKSSCQALLLPPLTPSLTASLDMPSFRRDNMHVLGRSPIRPPPPSFKLPTFSLPTSPLADDLSSEEHISFGSAVNLLARRTTASAKRARVVPPPNTKDIVELERHLLEVRCRHSQRVSEKKHVTNAESKLTPATCTPGTAEDVSGRTGTSRQQAEERSEEALKRSRFARLHILKSASKLTGNASKERRKASILERRKPPLNPPPAKRSRPNTPRLRPASSRPDLKKAYHDSRSSLEASPRFFSPDTSFVSPDAVDRSWRGLASRLSDCDSDGSLPYLDTAAAEESAHRGSHGVEYAEDADGRDHHISVCEMYFGKTSVEFSSTRKLEPVKASKLQQSVARLQAMTTPTISPLQRTLGQNAETGSGSMRGASGTATEPSDVEEIPSPQELSSRASIRIEDVMTFLKSKHVSKEQKARLQTLLEAQSVVS